MDFAAIPRPAFGRHAQHADDKTQTIFRGKAAARRVMMFKEARELLAAGLPRPGESLHTLLSGRVDLCVLLVAILDGYGVRCERLRTATLCFNQRNTVELLTLLESGKVGGLTLLASCFFRDHNKELAEAFAADLADHPGSVVAFARNHAKVCVFTWEDGTSLVCESSANLRTNSNVETLTLFNDPKLARWYAQWIDATVARHAESDKGRGCPAD
jgi:hypothetical protein